jgi:hypothetical protein
MLNERAEGEPPLNLNEAQQAKGNDKSKNLGTEIDKQSDLAKLTQNLIWLNSLRK